MTSEIIKNLRKMQKRLRDVDFISVPTGPFLREWREDFRQEAIQRAPDWRHGIIDSLRSAQDSKKFPLWARVYSEAPEARWSDLGTGIFSEDPQSSKQRYFPSVEGVQDWADDHGIPPWLLAHSIFEAGGTKPTRFFRAAADATNASMAERLSKFSGGIQAQARRDV